MKKSEKFRNRKKSEKCEKIKKSEKLKKYNNSKDFFEDIKSVHPIWE